MDAPQEQQPKSGPQSPPSFKPISKSEIAGICVLLCNDAWFLATLRSSHDAWYLLNVSLYIVWLIVTIAVLKYRWSAKLRDCPTTPFPMRIDGDTSWLGWYNLLLICLGALCIHPAITGIVADFRWRGSDYLKGRQANLVALIIFTGYSLFSLISVLAPR